MKTPNPRFALFVCTSIVAAASIMVSAADNDLQVTKVQANSTNTQITISILDQDDKLKGSPSVSLGGIPLTNVTATVQPGRRPTLATIVATFPSPLAPATYELVVDWGHQSTVDTEITIGGQGPQGPQGPQGLPGAPGATGAQGPVGPQGPKGDTGAPGTNGTNGTNGVDGAPGAKGDPGTPGAGAVVADVGPGGACGPVGGSRITDGAGNVSVVCDGHDGAPGADGAQGPAGPAGATSAPLGDPVYTAPVATETGTVRMANCPSGQVATALTSDGVDYGLRCATVTLQPGFMGLFAAFSSSTNTNLVPVDGGAVTLASSCPSGTVAIGVTGTGLTGTTGTIISIVSIAALCEGVGGVFPTANRLGGSMGTSFTLSCPAGQVVTGLKTTGSEQESLALRCQ